MIYKLRHWIAGKLEALAHMIEPKPQDPIISLMMRLEALNDRESQRIV